MDALKELTSLVEQYEVLRTNIQMMKKEEEKELKSLVNIGSEVYMQARCPEKKYIYVNVGLGFHVQFTLDEALAFIEKKTKKLQAYCVLRRFQSRDVVLKNADVEKVKEHYFSVGMKGMGESQGNSFIGTTQRTHVIPCLLQRNVPAVIRISIKHTDQTISISFHNDTTLNSRR